MNDKPKEEDAGDTKLVLPIICTNCKNEINLSMVFSLMAPELVKEKE